MGKSAPPPSQNSGDFTNAATQQGQASQANVNSQTQQNRPNQTNAQGATSTWTTGPDGRPIQSTQLGGTQQQAQDAQQRLQAARSGGAEGLYGQAYGELSQGLDTGSLAQLNNGDNGYQNAANAAYGQATSRLDPQWNQREEQTRSNLEAQGLDPTSAAAQNQMGQFNRDRNDAYGSAQNAAVQQGLGMQQAQFGMNLQARNQGLGEQQLGHNWTMGSINSLLNGQQVGNPQFQGFNASGQAQTPDYLGAMGMGSQQGQFDTQQGNQGWGSALSAAGAAASAFPFLFSDERLKENIRRFDRDAYPGVPYASWSWKDKRCTQPTFGVIAQDLQKVRPDLVITGADGFLRVKHPYLWRD